MTVQPGGQRRPTQVPLDRDHVPGMTGSGNAGAARDGNIREDGSGVVVKPNEAKKSRWPSLGLVALVVGIPIQAVLSFMIFMGGLNWTGWQYLAAVGQALVGLVLIVLLARRFPVVVLVVPIVSFLVWQALWNAAMREGHNPRACTATEEAALRELTPPDAILLELRGDNDRCFTGVTTTRPAEEVRAQFEQEFVAHGWERVPNDYPYATSAVRDEFRVDVDATPDGDVFINLSPR